MQFTRAFHVRRQVLVETEIWGWDVNPADVCHACLNVAGATHANARTLQEEFGGQLLALTIDRRRCRWRAGCMPSTLGRRRSPSTWMDTQDACAIAAAFPVALTLGRSATLGREPNHMRESLRWPRMLGRTIGRRYLEATLWSIPCD